MCGGLIDRVAANKHTRVCLLIGLCIAGSEAGAAAFSPPAIWRASAAQSSALETAKAARALASKGQFQGVIAIQFIDALQDSICGGHRTGS